MGRASPKLRSDLVLKSCDTCGSAWMVKTYTDKGTGASFRACWRPEHRRQARTALARRVAILKGKGRRTR
jgi:hypothetical protein